MSDAIPLSFSQLSMFKRCPQRYYWEKERGFTRQASRTTMVLGNYIHRLLAALARGEDYTDESQRLIEEDLAETLFEEEAMSIHLVAEQALAIVRRYERLVWQPIFAKWNTLLVEQPLETTLPNGAPILFIPDLVARAPDGRAWLIDRKTMRDFPTDLQTRLAYDDQITLYLYGLAACGLKVSGGIHDVIRTRLPRHPGYTKQGRLSRKACITDEETVKAAVDEMVAASASALESDLVADRDDYLGTMKMSKFFEQVVTDRNDDTLQVMARDYEATLETMAQARESRLWTRTFTRDCTQCPVRELCMADLTGGDIETLLATTFTDRKERDSLLPIDVWGDDENADQHGEG